jgi:hypothetical protein
MITIKNTPPPILPTKRNAGNDPESTLSAIVSLKQGNFTFECLSRKWDKRYRFEHPDLGLVIFDENGEKLIFTTIEYTIEEINEFKRFVIAWQHHERQYPNLR